MTYKPGEFSLRAVRKFFDVFVLGTSDLKHLRGCRTSLNNNSEDLKTNKILQIVLKIGNKNKSGAVCQSLLGCHGNDKQGMHGLQAVYAVRVIGLRCVAVKLVFAL